jgi:hypothetical protein
VTSIPIADFDTVAVDIGSGRVLHNPGVDLGDTPKEIMS